MSLYLGQIVSSKQFTSYPAYDASELLKGDYGVSFLPFLVIESINAVTCKTNPLMNSMKDYTTYIF